MANKELSLKISERYAAVRLMNEIKGGVELLTYIFDDVKAVVVTEEEWTAANLTKTPNADGTEQWNWDDKDEKPITISRETAEALEKKIKEKSDAGELGIKDMAIVELSKKLK